MTKLNLLFIKIDIKGVFLQALLLFVSKFINLIVFKPYKIINRNPEKLSKCNQRTHTRLA